MNIDLWQLGLEEGAGRQPYVTLPAVSFPWLTLSCSCVCVWSTRRYCFPLGFNIAIDNKDSINHIEHLGRNMVDMAAWNSIAPGRVPDAASFARVRRQLKLLGNRQRCKFLYWIYLFGHSPNLFHLMLLLHLLLCT